MYIAQVDIATVTLSAVIAFGTSVGVAFLSATALETQRQRRIKDAEKEALRTALYTEIYQKLAAINPYVENLLGDAAYKESVKDILANYIRQSRIYDSIHETPAVFYQVRDASLIEYAYEQLEKLPERLEKSLKKNREHDYEKEPLIISAKEAEKRDLRLCISLAFEFLDLDKLTEIAVAEKEMERRQASKDKRLVKRVDAFIDEVCWPAFILHYD